MRTPRPSTSLSFFLFLSALLLATSCGKSENDNPADNQASTLPEGWELIEVDANRATTKIFTHGHFHTSYTPCYREAWGAIKDPGAWDAIVRNTNAAIKAEPLAEERCFDVGSGNRMDSRVVARLSPDKREMLLLDASTGKVCTRIADPATTQALLEAVNVVIGEADREDCFRDDSN